MISDSAESYIVECVSNKLVVLKAKNAQPKMANFYVSHSPSLCEYDVLTNAELTADFHTPHAMGIERYARVSNGLDRVDSVDAMFTNMTNVWYKLKYLPGNEGRYWSDLNGAPVPGGEAGQRFTAFDDTYELCVARSNAFESLQANYVAVTNYEAKNHSRTIDPDIDPTLTNQVVHTVHTSLYDLEKRMLRVCVQEDCQSQFDYSVITSVTISLPVALQGCEYVVSNLTTARRSSQAAGSRLAARIMICRSARMLRSTAFPMKVSSFWVKTQSIFPW